MFKKLIIITLLAFTFFSTTNAMDDEGDTWSDVDSTHGATLKTTEHRPNQGAAPAVAQEDGQKKAKTIPLPIFSDNPAHQFRWAKFLWTNNMDPSEYKWGKELLKHIALDDASDYQFQALELLFTSVFSENQDFALAGIELYAKIHLLPESTRAKELLWKSFRYYKKAIPLIEEMVMKHVDHEDVLNGPKLLYKSLSETTKAKSINLFIYIENHSKKNSIKGEATRMLIQYLIDKTPKPCFR